MHAFSIRVHHALAVCLAVSIVHLMNSPGQAQSPKSPFEVGDKVEVDWGDNGMISGGIIDIQRPSGWLKELKNNKLFRLQQAHLVWAATLIQLEIPRLRRGTGSI